MCSSQQYPPTVEAPCAHLPGSALQNDARYRVPQGRLMRDTQRGCLPGDAGPQTLPRAMRWHGCRATSDNTCASVSKVALKHQCLVCSLRHVAPPDAHANQDGNAESARALTADAANGAAAQTVRATNGHDRYSLRPRSNRMLQPIGRFLLGPARLYNRI